MATDKSVLNYECSGSAPAGGDNCTETWSGSGTVPRIITNPLRQGFLVAGGLYDNGRLVLAFSPQSKGRQVTIACNSGTTMQNDDLFSVVVAPADGGSDVNLSLDGSGNIIGKTLTFTDGSDAHTFSWSDIQIQFPPSPSSPR
jgi:hypothetical protein